MLIHLPFSPENSKIILFLYSVQQAFYYFQTQKTSLVPQSKMTLLFSPKRFSFTKDWGTDLL